MSKRFETVGNVPEPGPAQRGTAIREAEHILRETEPQTAGAGYHEARFWAWDAFGGKSALAESLSAILPVLDELALDAVMDTEDEGFILGAFDVSAAWWASRATDAALEGGR